MVFLRTAVDRHYEMCFTRLAIWGFLLGFKRNEMGQCDLRKIKLSGKIRLGPTKFAMPARENVRDVN